MHPKALFYHNYLVKHSIQRNIKRGGGKRVGAGREKSPSCTKITRNESIMLQSKSSLQIFGKLMEKGTIKLSQPTDSSNSEVFVNV